MLSVSPTKRQCLRLVSAPIYTPPPFGPAPSIYVSGPGEGTYNRMNDDLDDLVLTILLFNLGLYTSLAKNGKKLLQTPHLK